MNHPLLLLLFCIVSFQLLGQDALNVELFGQFNRGDVRYSGTWSYVAPNGSEYALIGAKTGTAVYTIDDPNSIEEVGFIPGPETNWREITTIGDYAYVVTDVQGVDHGMQVIDLSDLPNGVSLVTNYTTTFTKGHIIQKDIFNDDPYVYVSGTTTTSGVHIIDVSNPATPVEIGLYQPGYYIHDCHVRDNILFAAAFDEATIDIIDITDKTNPTLITKIQDPGANTHSASMTMDGKYLFIADELDGLPGRIWNIEDYNDMFEVATYTANISSLVHNPYILGDFAFISHNTEGLRVLDIADPVIPVEVGYYDTFSGPSGGFNGLWSACPYFPSGKIIGGNRTDGLYIWTFNNLRAGRLYGAVRDSVTQEALFAATITLENGGDVEDLNVTPAGEFRYGALPAVVQLTASHPGYLSKTITVELTEGSQLDVAFELVSDEVSSTEEVIKENIIQIFPNPFKELTTIDLSQVTGAVEVLLIDGIGKVLARYDVTTRKELVLSKNQFPSKGTYWVQVLDQDKQVIETSTLMVH